MRKPFRSEALILALVACGFFAGTSLLAKFIATADGVSLHPFQVAFGRFLFGTLFLSPLFAFAGTALVRSRAPRTYLVRSTASVGAASCIYASVGALPLADVTAITYSSPLFMLLLAAIVLRERVTASRWGVVALGFVGVLIMTAPKDSFQPIALIALLGAAFMAIELISLRIISTRDSAMTALFLTNAVGLMISALLIPFVWQPTSGAQWQLMVLMGVITASGQVFFVRAAAIGEANMLAPVFYSTLVYAAIYGYVFFDEAPTGRTLIGASLIIFAGLLLSRNTSPDPPRHDPGARADDRI